MWSHVTHGAEWECGAVGKGLRPSPGLTQESTYQGCMNSEHNLQSTELVHKLALGMDACRKKEKEKAGQF